MFTSRLKSERTDALVKALIALDSEENVYRVLEDLLTIREVSDLLGVVAEGWDRRLRVVRDRAVEAGGRDEE